MKTILLMIIAVGFLAIHLKAQDVDNRSSFNFGVKAGGNYANVYDERGDEFRADGKFGFVAGVFASIPLGNMFGLQPEILFSQKGFKATGSILGTNYGLTRTKNFIDIPLFITVKPIPQLTVLAGPQVSYLLRQKDDFRSDAGTIEIIEEFENDNVRKNILGAVAGIDVNVDPLVIGMRAGWDFYTNNGDGSGQTPRYKNAWVQATLGFRLL